MNTTTLIGRLAQDPDIRITTGGTTVATFRLAVSNPQDKDNPNWIPVKALGKTAEAIGEYLAKGNQVGVSGRIETSEWDDKETGERRWKLEVLARTVDFLNTNNKPSDTEQREEATL